MTKIAYSNTDEDWIAIVPEHIVKRWARKHRIMRKYGGSSLCI